MTAAILERLLLGAPVFFWLCTVFMALVDSRRPWRDLSPIFIVVRVVGLVTLTGAMLLAILVFGDVAMNVMQNLSAGQQGAQP